MPREFSRHQRVSSEIQKELAVLLQKGIKDPRVGFVTVNAVKVSRDLSVAKVYITVLGAGKEETERNIEVLTQASSFIRHELGRRMRMRTIPELRFVYDEAVERGIKLASLLEEIEREESRREED